MADATATSTVDIKTPLTDREAGRVKTVFQGRDIELKLRELLRFSPETIARTHQLNAVEIALAAGRRGKK